MTLQSLKQVDRKFSAQEMELGRIHKELRLLRERISSVAGASSPSTAFGAASISATLSAGQGLTGGGTIPGTVTFNVGAGDGIDVSADAVAVDVTDIIDTDYGLTEDSNNIRVSLSSPSGLEFSGGSLQIADSVAGDGLDISGKILAVQVGDGVEIVDDYVTVDLPTHSGFELDGTGLYMGTPTTLSVSTSNSVTSNTHEHDVTTSSNPGASASILQSNASGHLQLVRLGAGVSPSYPLHALSASGAQARFAYDGTYIFDIIVDGAGIANFWPYAKEVRHHYDASNYVRFVTNSDGSVDIEPVSSGTLNPVVSLMYDAGHYADFEIGGGGNLTISPTGHLVVNPAGDYLRPQNNYDVNLGSPTAMWLSLYAAELWVQYMIAQETMATIGGRILIGPTTYLVEDLDAATDYITDGEFDNWTVGALDDWYQTGGVVQETTEVYSGSNAVKLPTTGWLRSSIYQTITIPSGTTQMVLSFYTQGDGTNAGLYHVWDNTNGSYIVAQYTSTGVTGAEYEPFVAFLSVASNCTDLWVYFYSPDTAPSNSYAYFDLVKLHDNVQIATEHNNLAVGDNAHFEYGGYVEFVKIASGPTGSGPYYYTIARDLDDTGSNAWVTGRALFNTGVTGDGFVDAYSLQGILTGYGPALVGNVRYGEDFNEWTPFWAIGNLNGLYDYGSDTYGAAFGRYLSGHPWISMDASSGIRFMYYNVMLANWDMSGDITIGQDSVGKSNVYISSDSVQLRTGTFENIVLHASGDASFGYVTDSQANMFWNNTNKRLEFRGGVAGEEVQLYINTGGELVAGDGDVILNSDDGIIITIPNAYAERLAYSFSDGSGLFAQVGTQHQTLKLEAVAQPSTDTGLVLSAVGTDGAIDYGARIVLEVDGGGSVPDGIFTLISDPDLNSAQPYADLTVDYFTITAPVSGDGDLRVGGGLYVGNTAVDPDDNDIWCDGEISTDGGTTRWSLGGYSAGAPTADGYVTLYINGSTYQVLVNAV